MRKTIIAPSVLSANLSCLLEDSRNVIDQGADWIHLDVMDGHFVPNLSFGPPVIKSLRDGISDVFFDCHMMVSHPWNWVEAVKKAGGSGYTFHIETTPEESQFFGLLNDIRAKGMKTGIALKPGTQLSEMLYDGIRRGLIDMVLIMTVEPGFSGQKFMADMMEKVRSLRRDFPELNVEVDGGVKVENIDIVADAGANVIVSATGVFEHPNPREAIRVMRESIDSKQNNSN
ncbi:unnamed protein product [Blepharisma stoltei]|uniref:Ribulose-phosphate 3-epimerase n=1 Tax=Blepharisma stoltei TaxID=1481888 RepID=A0AAU9J4Y7_9CILI|nr:unnamed protein product [Blepharisma stoltei]